MQTKFESTAPALTVIGIDIGKDVFHVVGFDADGKIALRRKIKRLALTDTFRKLAVRRRHGSVPERPFRQPHPAPARP